MLQKAAVFIGSSSEALPLAGIVKEKLLSVAEVRLWNEGVFEPGLTTIESLERNLHKFEFGGFVFSGEDQVTIKGLSLAAVRDNVIFELGLFMGLHGRSRTAIIYDKTRRPDVLSDLAGVTMATFELSGAYADLSTALKTPCKTIETQLMKLAPEEWTATWEMHSGSVTETLLLFVDGDRLRGRRLLSGSQEQIFLVSGFRTMGCDTLSYAREDGSGCGTILMQHLGAGRAVGQLTYMDAWNTGKITSLQNEWSRELSEKSGLSNALSKPNRSFGH